jgi:hypothetical protein
MSINAIQSFFATKKRPMKKWEQSAILMNSWLFIGLLIPLGACASDGARDPAADYARKASELYAQSPDLAACDPGMLKPAETAAVLAVVNDIRRLHGLGSVVYDSQNEDEVMRAALMFAANEDLSHRPSEDWKCYSKAGAQGAATSNIGGGVASPYLRFESSEEDVVSWHTDVDNTIAGNVGHRRWLLDPFLKRISYGRVSALTDVRSVSTGSAIKVIYPDTWTGGRADAEFIAYPIGDYPRKYYSPRAIFSFSVVLDLSEKQKNKAVDFSAAEVSVVKRGGESVAVEALAYDTDGFGLPNNLQFRADSIEIGAYYDVRVTGAKVAGVSRDYAYWFRIID